MRMLPAPAARSKLQGRAHPGVRPGSFKRAQAIDWAEKYPLPECGPIETAPVF